MRLLKLVGPNKFSLIQVPTHNTLPYAILSHTWTHGQEVNYQELINDGGKDKTGYRKIEFCGEQATKDGYLYFWVDTCCIDKSDPVELATAINSMFRWYLNAKKCYVYLEDVSTADCGGGSDTDIQANQSTWEADFRKSKWFTRGWTLQELIAPETVEFFSKEGKRLGDKKLLEGLIHEITSIPTQALQGSPFSDFSTAERKEWGAKRQTTEEEDMAYCLIGLCEVSMPLLYGEGKEIAMKRLQMAIKEFSNDHNELDDLEENHSLFIVPFERNSNFTGRETQLSELAAKAFEQDQTSKLAITGLGGTGKTQLALEFAYQIRKKHWNCSVIWIPVINMESMLQAYLDVARKLCIPGCEEEKTDIKKVVHDFLSAEKSGKWLLVFDNADDIDLWIGQSSRLIDYLPRSKNGCIIFTTRDRKTAVKLAQKNIVEVPEMDEDVAIELLRKCLVTPDLVKDQPATNDLLKELTYLPLAITQAAAYINENRIAVCDYLSLLAEQEEDVIDLLSEEFEDDKRYHNVKNPVATTWLISFEQIRHRDPLAAEYLSFMACIDSKDIPQSLLLAGPSRKKEIDAIGTLDAYSFVTKHATDRSLNLHRLVHLATRNWLRKQDLIAQWTKRAITRLEEVFPDDDHQNRRVWRIYLPHVRYTLTSRVIEDVEHRIELAWRFGKCLNSDGRYNEAEEQLSKVFSMRKKVLGQEHPDTLTSMAHLASTYRDQGRWKEAENLEVIIVEMRKRVLGQEHPDTLISINNLALTYWEQGRWKEAEELGVVIVEARKRILGQEHPDTLTSMAYLTLVYWKQGRWKEAEEVGVIVLEMRKKILGQEHPDTLTSMAYLTLLYSEQGRLKEAEDLAVVALEMRKRVLGAEHPDTLVSIASLATIYVNEGRWKEAEDLEVGVLEISKKVLGQEHPDTLAVLSNLATIYSKQWRLKEAEDLLIIILETKKRVFGHEHPNTLISISNLATIYTKQARWKEAEDLEVVVVEARERMLGQEHPDTLFSMSNLAAIYANQGLWTDAEVLGEIVLEARKRVLGHEHPDTLTTISNMASTYWEQGRWKEAEELGVVLVETSKRVLGQEHPDTLTSMSNLAWALKSQDRYTESIELMVSCVRLQERILGLDHPITVSSLATLGKWQAEQRIS